MKSITEQGVGLYLACGYAFGVVPGDGHLLGSLPLCLSLETVETDSFLWFWGMGGAAGWVVFFWAYWCWVQAGMLGIVLLSPTKSMKNKFMKIVRTQSWVMGHGSRT